MAVTKEEDEIVRRSFGFEHRIPRKGYLVTEPDVSRRKHRLVYLKMGAQTNYASNESTGDLIEDYQPKYLILIGTAGGAGGNGISHGDVVVADFVDDSTYWKYKEGAAFRRKLPHDHPCGRAIQDHIEPLIKMRTDWPSYVPGAQRPSEGTPNVHIGEIVSGNILLGDPRNSEQRRITDFFDKSLAFEMEAFGVSRAVFHARQHSHYNPKFLIVRGISDLVNSDGPTTNQQDRVRWTPYAVHMACSLTKLFLDDFFENTPVPIPTGGS